jgi:hypothetical protein
MPCGSKENNTCRPAHGEVVVVPVALTVQLIGELHLPSSPWGISTCRVALSQVLAGTEVGAVDSSTHSPSSPWGYSSTYHPAHVVLASSTHRPGHLVLLVALAVSPWGSSSNTYCATHRKIALTVQPMGQ